jgi:hypothetical protein
VAEVAAKMNVDRMAAAAIRRCRAGVYGRGAKGYRSSKTENVISHSVCSFVTVRLEGNDASFLFSSDVQGIRCVEIGRPQSDLYPSWSTLPN